MSDNEACLFALLGMDMEVLPAVLRVDWELQTRHHRSWWSDPSCIWWQILRVWKLDHDLRRKCKVSYWCNVFSCFLLKVGRATWKCSSWQVLWRGWRRRKEAKGQRSPMRPSWESRKWSFFLIFGVDPLLVHLLLPGLLLKEAPHDGDGGDDADDYCLGEDDPCSVLHPFNSGGWSLDAIG